jgi:protein phosphatase
VQLNNFMPELVGAKSDKGPVRSANEDAYWVSHTETPTELGALYIVADGVGGQEAGDVAANKATEIISKAFYEHRQAEADIPTALERAIRMANQAIFELAQERGGGKMGCTVVMAVLHNGYLYVAHVGDARAYLLLGDQLKRLTRDDTWVQKQVEANVLTPQEAANHELRNVVTQVLGNKEEIEVHLSHPLEVYSDDVFLLCSDGLHDPLNFREIHELLRGKSAQAAAEDLVQASINAQTHDNVTAVVVNVGQIPGKVWPVAAAAPAPAGRSGIPLWVFASLTVMVLIFLAILFFFVLPAFNARQDSAEATAVPDAAPSAEGVPEETESPALPPAPTKEATAVPLATATVGPTATLEPLPTTTPNPTDTPPPDIVQARGCIILDSFVWQDAQIETNSCDQFAEDTIANGEEVIILENSPVTVNGPDSACDANNFRKVQSVADPSLEGWVLGIYIQPLQPGESCAP